MDDIIIKAIIGVVSGLVLWLFKIRHDDKKDMEKKLIQSQINDELMKQQFEDYKEFKQVEEAKYSDILTEIKTSLSTLIKDVTELKVQIARITK